MWLDVTCLYRTRSEAQKAIRGGKVEVNRQSGKPHRELKEGDEIELSRPLGRKQKVVVRAFSEHHIPKAEARKLYDDITPKPTPEEIEARRAERVYRAAAQAAGGPLFGLAATVHRYLDACGAGNP